jgi:hypothetical protein
MDLAAPVFWGYVRPAAKRIKLRVRNFSFARS